MSEIPGQKSVNPKIHFEAGMKDLFRFDQVRLINIVGTIQYGTLYFISYFLVGMFIEYIFPPFTTKISVNSLTLQILLQCLVVLIAVFYVQKFIESIPGILSFFPHLFDREALIRQGYVPYGIQEYKGEMISSLILVGVQFNLLKKVILLAKLLTNRIFHRQYYK